MTEDIRYSYHRDPLCPERVLTIARTLINPTTIRYACSINSVDVLSPEKANELLGDKFGGALTFLGPVKIVVDKFSKAVGRKIALGRLQNQTKCQHVTRAPGSTPMLDVLADINMKSEGKIGWIAWNAHQTELNKMIDSGKITVSSVSVSFPAP